MKGRKPKSTLELKQSGTYRGHRHGTRLEHVSGGTSPSPDVALGVHGQRLWDTVVDRLPKSLLDTLDSSKLTMLCLAVQSVYDLYEAGSVASSIKAMAMVDRLGRQFGLSPTDRASIKADPDANAVDPLAEFRAAFKGTG